MVALESIICSSLKIAALSRRRRQKKADVGDHPEVFGHVGLLVDRPPGTAGLPFIKSSDNFDQAFGGAI